MRLPRKLKKVLLGRKLNTSKLRKLLNTVQVITPAKTYWEKPKIKPYLFCPFCGCKQMYTTGNRALYPECWETFRCNRCNNVVGYIDNSPFIHALECKDNNYDPTF